MKKLLLPLLAVGMVATPALAITWCHDYTIHRVSGGTVNPTKLSVTDVRKLLAAHGYKKFPFSHPTDSLGEHLLPGDAVIVGDDHSGFVSARGRIDHFIQASGGGHKSGDSYLPTALPPPSKSYLGGLFRGDTLPQMIGRLSIKRERKVEVWRKRVQYQKGRRLAGPVAIPARQPQPTDIGITLEAGKAYFIVGEGTVSLWDRKDMPEGGCDSVFRYSSPLISGGGPIIVWGQLKLINPTIHLSEAIEQHSGRKPVYDPGHVYEAVVFGEGRPLKALVFDGGGYGDNRGQLRVSVYEAVPRR